jgi:hypothetical protein
MLKFHHELGVHMVISTLFKSSQFSDQAIGRDLLPYARLLHWYFVASLLFVARMRLVEFSISISITSLRSQE